MPDFDDVYGKKQGGEFIKVDDLQNRARRVTIKSYEWIEVPKFKDPDVKVPKLKINLEETDKVLVLNIPSGEEIRAVYGKPDNDAWVGKKLILEPHMFGQNRGIMAKPAYKIDDGFGDAPRTEVPAAIKEVAAAFNVKKERGYFEELDSDEDIPF